MFTAVRLLNYYPGYLTPEHMANIAHNLASHHCHEALYNFAEQLGFSREKIHNKQLLKSMEDLLCQVIFAWTSRSPANSVKTLAKILLSCGMFQEAIRLDPLCKWRDHEMNSHLETCYRSIRQDWQSFTLSHQS